MDTVAINQFLVLFTWFALIALVILMLLIARFYQNFSGKKTYFQGFLVPLILLGIASVRYTSLDQLARDDFADLLLGVGGMMLSILCVRLYWVMVIRGKGNDDNQSD